MFILSQKPIGKNSYRNQQIIDFNFESSFLMSVHTLGKINT